MRPKGAFQATLTPPVWSPLGFTLREIIVHRKSLGRAMINWVLLQVQGEVHGVVIDLASGRAPSYWRLMELDRVVKQLISIDLLPGCQPTIVADINNVPLKSGVADVGIIGGSLMHVPEPLKVVEEVRRLLKAEGLLIFAVPFVYHVTPDPKDFWRFTPDSIAWVLQRCNFKEVIIRPVGDRWSAMSSLLLGVLRPQWLFAPLVFPLCFYLDRLSLALLGRVGRQPPPCPIAYVVLARAT